ncbi:NACHT domain-containing protein [Amycolatopsis sp. NPDC049691]|uniref:NACHT domain-containing protein n=1 Tax=Amycolatopsis sp. NPDC049691 TaxID=3155155 RepID=UPI003443490F
MSIEAALVGLGAAAVRSATKLWLGDKTIAAAVGDNVVEQLAGRLNTHLTQRKLHRMIEHFTDAVAERLTPMMEFEYRDLRENERLAAIEAVRATFEQAGLDNDDLFAADLDARRLDRHFRSKVPDATRDLSSGATTLYGLLLRECCGYVIEIARGLPVFSPDALTEILRRETEIVAGIRDVLGRLPQRRRATDFGYDYRQLVARTLDHVQMFGATLSEASRRYPLSVAYLSLTAVSESAGEEAFAPSRRIEELLSRTRRLFIRGEAGLGKTTLLQWIAVRGARSDFPAPLTGWNDLIPFFIPLRRYAERELPPPERFLDEVGRHIASEMPKGWVQELLRTGRAIVLVDGVDELVAERRGEARSWLRQLVTAFPEMRCVVTSRPSAAPPEWLRGEEFTVADLQPMVPSDVRVFVDRWHQAVRAQCPDETARRELDRYERGLLRQLTGRYHLRKLAGYPLLCALLCALHRDRRGDLPDNRMELYDVALQMLLERRDAERRVSTLPGLNRTRKTLLLSDLAYWFLRNDFTDAAVSRAIEQLGRRLRGMPEVGADAGAVYRHLLERTGLLREPVDGRVDFVHRTFQEHLAARAAIVDTDDVGTLVAHGHLDQWHEVVVMAAGHASRAQREELLSGLVDRGDREGQHRYTLHLLAVACLETSPELEPRLHGEITRRAAELLPPKSLSAARAFASAGLFVLDLLAAAEVRTAREAAATVRAAAEIGVDEALPVISRFAGDKRKSVQHELVTAWPRFDAESYARQVLADLQISALEVHDPAMAPSLRHLKHVKELECSVPQLGSLAFVPAQVEKLTLSASGLVDLSTLTTPALRTLAIDATKAVDVAPLVALDRLESLFLSVKRIRNLSALHEMASLRELTLLGGCRVVDLAGLGVHASPLDSLALAFIEDLKELTPLAFLTNPHTIRLVGCHHLSSLTGMPRQWAASLSTLAIQHCAPVDITPLTKLGNLLELDLTGTPVTDLMPLAELPYLRRLTVSSARTARDLIPITRMPVLRELRISQGGPVNLAGLAGVPNLLVRVQGSTPVSGGHLLGDGSRVEVNSVFD